jgi:sporulation protein YlmC with PRC-barrel domain
MRTIDLGEIRKMSVLDAGSGERIGELVDIVVEPTEGRLLGVVIRTGDGEEAVLSLESVRIGENAVMVSSGAPLETRASSGALRAGVLGGGLLSGANVVTEDGRLLGKIKDIEILPELGLVAYKVAGTVMQKIFGGGYYIAGDVPVALSSDGARMIVPTDTEERHAAGSVEELLKPKS